MGGYYIYVIYIVIIYASKLKHDHNLENKLGKSLSNFTKPLLYQQFSSNHCKVMLLASCLHPPPTRYRTVNSAIYSTSIAYVKNRKCQKKQCKCRDNRCLDQTYFPKNIFTNSSETYYL